MPRHGVNYSELSVDRTMTRTKRRRDDELTTHPYSPLRIKKTYIFLFNSKALPEWIMSPIVDSIILTTFCHHVLHKEK